MIYRFIPFRRYDPFLKTALNEVALNSVKNGKPIVWLSGWSKDCVNIGYGQRFEDVLNLPEIRRRKLSIVRRQGGGGAMYLSKDGEISWAVIAPENCFPESVNEIYKRVCARIIAALKQLGISAKHKPVNDVVTKKGKISGATIKKDKGIVYVGGTLLFKVNQKLLRELLRPERDTLKRRSVSEKKKRVTSVSLESKAFFGETVDALKQNLLKGVNFVEDNWSKKELARAKVLAAKYRSKEWVYQR